MEEGGQHLLRLRFELGGLPLELGARSVLGLAGITGQFQPVDGGRLATDQALCSTDEQHRREEEPILSPSVRMNAARVEVWR